MRMSYRSIDIKSIRSWSASKIMMAVMLSTIVTAGYNTGCKSQISATLVQGTKSSASSSGLKPITAKPGETVTLTGVGFKSSQKNVVKITTASGTVVTASATVLSDTAATFVMPTGAGLGLTSVVLESNGKQMTGAMSFVANLASNALPILIVDQSEVCSTLQYIDKNGDTKTGTKNCSYTGSGGSAPNAWDVRAGTVVNGVTGKLKVNCRNRANLTLQDMDTGRSVSGIESSVLTTTAAHGLASNQAVRLLYEAAPIGANNYTTYYVISVSATTLQLSESSGPGDAMLIYEGTGITVHRWQDGTADIWDTIDDYNNGISGIPGTVVSGWSDNDCGGVESVAGDGNVWKDVTTSNGVTASSCGTTATNCTMQDKITGLWWSKQQTDAVWNAALSTCGSTLNGTTYAGNSVAGYNGQTGWRLPTQKELKDAYNHGIRSAASANWITEAAMENNFFSASSRSFSTIGVWVVSLANNFEGSYEKDSATQVVCVR